VIEFLEGKMVCHTGMDLPVRALANSTYPGHPYFVKYSTAINKEFITKAFTFVKGWGLTIGLTEDQINDLSKYPESFGFVEEK
jgi:hypothetical protein